VHTETAVADAVLEYGMVQRKVGCTGTSNYYADSTFSMTPIDARGSALEMREHSLGTSWLPS
jgi:hypothetical protein